MRLARIAAIALLGIVLVFSVACKSEPQEQITYCAAGCQTSWLGDGICQSACNNMACYYDNGDCPSNTPTPTIAPTPTVTPTVTPTPIPSEPTAIPTLNPEPTPTYSYYWYIGEWTSCSLACGGGSQERTVMCLRSDITIMNEGYCTFPKPATIQECNTQACPTPTPVSWPTLIPTEVPHPVLLNVTWTDTNDNDSVDSGDLLAFVFSKPMDILTLDTAMEANAYLAGYAHSFGSVLVSCVWGTEDTILTITLGTDCSSNLGRNCYNPTADVKDKGGRADATLICVSIPQ